MSTIIILLAVAIGFLIIITALTKKPKSGRRKVGFSYASQGTLLSQPEQVLYFRLVEAFPNHIVFAQVSMQMVVKPDASNPSEKSSLRNKISNKTFDFVICNKMSRIVCVVELDDSSHNKTNAIKRDNDKNMALQSAGIPLIRFDVKRMPTSMDIRQKIII